MWRTEDPTTESGNVLELVQRNDAQALKLSILHHLMFTLAHDPSTARRPHWWVATCMAVRDRALAQSFRTMRTHRNKNVRRVNYLSLEYLMGRLLENNLRNTGLYEPAQQALKELGQDLDSIINREPDMGLGNGGLGRLAACFLDSLSTLDLPAVGYGIHYEFGLFRQEFVNGRQVERCARSLMIVATPGRCGSKPSGFWEFHGTSPSSAGSRPP
jgi:starch phosphorylase